MANTNKIADKSSGTTVTDEKLLEMKQDSQEFAELHINDKLRFFQLQAQTARIRADALERKQKGFGLRAEVVDGNLVVTIPMNEKPEPSSTGKTLSIASTHGNVKSALRVNGKEVVIGLNAYIPA